MQAKFARLDYYEKLIDQAIQGCRANRPIPKPSVDQVLGKLRTQIKTLERRNEELEAKCKNELTNRI